jgi:hypothetical protein
MFESEFGATSGPEGAEDLVVVSLPFFTGASGSCAVVPVPVALAAVGSKSISVAGRATLARQW